MVDSTFVSLIALCLDIADDVAGFPWVWLCVGLVWDETALKGTEVLLRPRNPKPEDP